MMLKIARKIAVWGDSVLKGIILDEKQGRYKTLEQNCARVSAETLGLQIHNNSRFGCTAPKGLELLRRALDKGGECDAAVLEYGGNDCDFDWAAIAAHPDAEHQPHTPLSDFVACYREMIDVLVKRGIRPILMSLPPLDATRYFNWITKSGLSRENILRWLGDVQHIYRFHERYSIAITNLARQLGCLYVDVRDAFLAVPRCGDLICADGIHPNERGHRVMQQAFAEFVASYPALGEGA